MTVDIGAGRKSTLQELLEIAERAFAAEPAPPVPSGPSVVEHFGERIRRGKYGFRISRELYALPNRTNTTRMPRTFYTDEMWEAQAELYEDDEHTRYSDLFVRRQRALALMNYDLNMAFFDQLDPEQFNATLDETLAAYPEFHPVASLGSLRGAQGVYILVLDDHRQAYIGQASDIHARIRQHWAGVKPFDRTLFGRADESVLSIGSFRPLDTTRIFAAKSRRRDSLEENLVANFPPEFLLNRILGGTPEGIRALFLAAEMKRRELSSGQDSERGADAVT